MIAHIDLRRANHHSGRRAAAVLLAIKRFQIRSVTSGLEALFEELVVEPRHQPAHLRRAQLWKPAAAAARADIKAMRFGRGIRDDVDTRIEEPSAIKTGAGCG